MNSDFWENRFISEPFPWGTKESELARIADTLFSEAGLRKILEIGCGSGRDCVFFAKRGYDVTGIDISKEAIHMANNHAKKNNTKIRFYASSFQDFDPETFDAIFSYNTFHLFHDNLDECINKAQKLLIPSGLLIIAVFSDLEKSERTGRPVHKFTHDELESTFSPYFDILRLERFDFPEEHGGSKHAHKEWLLIAQKN
jgi:cyclopropane fatty-acyl-phospholipid synthase-like methyltransferase